MSTRMNEHSQISDLLPLYVSGRLSPDLYQAIEKHLPGCAECQSDLALWKAVSGEIVASDQDLLAPRRLAEQVLAQVDKNQPDSTPSFQLPRKFDRLFRLLHAQMPLVHREIWPASALVTALGFIAALVSAQSAFVYALAPLVAAACVSLIYGPENDAAFELTLSTPTSPRQILLARLVLVFGYNLILVLVATLGLLPILESQPVAGTLVMSWLAPMTFLSAAALVLSLWTSATNAISTTYLAWLAYLLIGPLRTSQAELNLSPAVFSAITAYQNFWQATWLLLALSVALFAAAVWLAGRDAQRNLIPA